MRLDSKSIREHEYWNSRGVKLPEFNREDMAARTAQAPEWVHFGGGNIFRGFIAHAHQKLLDAGKSSTGIIVVETFDDEVIDKIYMPYDNLTLLVSMAANGTFEKKVIASVAESFKASDVTGGAQRRMAKIFVSPSLQMVSFTITEKGYGIHDASGKFLEPVRKDMENGPSEPHHVMSLLTSLLYKRYMAGELPLTCVSMDNCADNGDKLKAAVMTIADEWWKGGFVDKGFIAYLEDAGKVAFPISMIDKITPRPSDEVKSRLESDGFSQMDVVITDKGTHMAPFVNAEVSEYLIVEDTFAGGRPKLEDAGVVFTDRKTVHKVETMKVTTCLNPLHTALAVTGCLLGHTKISDEMQDEDLKRLVLKIGYDEGLRVVTDPGILNPRQFLDEVVNERFANPYIPDTPQRIATDTSQKLAIRFGKTIQAYLDDERLDAASLVGISLAIAAWCRYLIGIDDEGKNFEVSPDPMLEDLSQHFKGVKLGTTASNIRAVLTNKVIFGVDLYAAGLGETIEAMFYEMLAGTGAVRRTIQKHLDGWTQ